MIELWTRLHQADAVLMLFVAALCLLGYAAPGFMARRGGQAVEGAIGFAWLVFLFVGILAFVEWIVLVFL